MEKPWNLRAALADLYLRAENAQGRREGVRLLREAQRLKDRLLDEDDGEHNSR